jgi:hypothetical protein
MLKNDTAVLPRFLKRLAVNKHFTRLKRQQPGKQIKSRAFPAAGRAYYTYKLAVAHRKTYIGESVIRGAVVDIVKTDIRYLNFTQNPPPPFLIHTFS